MALININKTILVHDYWNSDLEGIIKNSKKIFKGVFFQIFKVKVVILFS